MMESEVKRALKEVAVGMKVAPYRTVSSYWAAGRILDLIGEVERLTEQRNRFAIKIAEDASCLLPSAPEQTP